MRARVSSTIFGYTTNPELLGIIQQSKANSTELDRQLSDHGRISGENPKLADPIIVGVSALGRQPRASVINDNLGRVIDYNSTIIARNFNENPRLHDARVAIAE